MEKSIDLSSSVLSVPLGERATVRDEAAPLIRIIHLDCGAGGDCTVLFTDSEFIVIDGGKVETGTRLSALLSTLMDNGVMPLSFVVSHFDTDHYLGLFHAVKKICIDAIEKKHVLTEIKIITPATAEVLNRDLYGKAKNMEEASSVAVACTQLKTGVESVRNIKITYKDANTLAFKNGFSLVLQNGPVPLSPCICNGNNGSSLQWILKDTTGRTKTTYYTGGDAEAGPLDASIVKLDHHGSTVGTTNAKAKHLKSTLYWVIMGAGRGHKHPGQGLLTHAQKSSSHIVMTQHHFIDDYRGHKLVFVSRTPPHWGDAGFSLFAGEKILVNIDKDRGLLTVGKNHQPIDSETCTALDADMQSLLDITRLIDNCPIDKACDRSSVPEPPPLECLHPGCLSEATEMSLNPISTAFFACEMHGVIELEQQQKLYQAKRTKEEQAKLKRKIEMKKREDDDSDFEGDSEEDEEEEAEEEEDYEDNGEEMSARTDSDIDEEHYFEEGDDELIQKSQVHKKHKK